MHIGRTNVHNEYVLHIRKWRNMNISEITKEKDLGITFSNDLKFNKHSCLNKANMKIGIIR